MHSSLVMCTCNYIPEILQCWENHSDLNMGIHMKKNDIKVIGCLSSFFHSGFFWKSLTYVTVEVLVWLADN